MRRAENALRASPYCSTPEAKPHTPSVSLVIAVLPAAGDAGDHCDLCLSRPPPRRDARPAEPFQAHGGAGCATAGAAVDPRRDARICGSPASYRRLKTRPGRRWSTAAQAGAPECYRMLRNANVCSCLNAPAFILRSFGIKCLCVEADQVAPKQQKNVKRLTLRDTNEEKNTAFRLRPRPLTQNIGRFRRYTTE